MFQNVKLMDVAFKKLQTAYYIKIWRQKFKNLECKGFVFYN